MKKLLFGLLLIQTTGITKLYSQDSTWKKVQKFQYSQFSMFDSQRDSVISVLKKAQDIIPGAFRAYQIEMESGRELTVWDSVRVPVEIADTTKKRKK